MYRAGKNLPYRTMQWNPTFASRNELVRPVLLNCIPYPNRPLPRKRFKKNLQNHVYATQYLSIIGQVMEPLATWSMDGDGTLGLIRTIDGTIGLIRSIDAGVRLIRAID